MRSETLLFLPAAPCRPSHIYKLAMDKRNKRAE
jgi:hypothetical protein